MSLVLQWITCCVLGMAALAFLIRNYTFSGQNGKSECGGCECCAAARTVQRLGLEDDRERNRLSLRLRR